MFVPLKKGYNGPVSAVRVATGFIYPMTHQVQGRETLCKINMDAPTKGMTSYGMNWVPVDRAVVCKKCQVQMQDLQSKQP